MKRNRILSILKVKGLFVFNILRSSFLHPNKTTVISRITGKIV